MQNVINSTAEIFDRLKEVRGLQSDAELAREMGVLPKKLAVWRLRNTLPMEELIAYCRLYHFNLESVLTGKDQIEVNYLQRSGSGIVYVNEPEISIHPDVVKQINQFLLEMSEDQKKDVLKYVEEKKLLAELMAERQAKKAL